MSNYDFNTPQPSITFIKGEWHAYITIAGGFDDQLNFHTFHTQGSVFNEVAQECIMQWAEFKLQKTKEYDRHVRAAVNTSRFKSR